MRRMVALLLSFVAVSVVQAPADWHGFLDTAGTFTPIDGPGAIYTILRGINNEGQIVGEYFQPVPEPGSILLLGSGVAGLGALTWRRHRRTRAGSE